MRIGPKRGSEFGTNANPSNSMEDSSCKFGSTYAKRQCCSLSTVLIAIKFPHPSGLTGKCLLFKFSGTRMILFAVTLELRLNPASRRADASRLALRVGKSVPRPETDEPADCRLDILGRNVGQNCRDLVVLFYRRFHFRCDRRDSESPRRKSEKDDDVLKHSNSAG